MNRIFLFLGVALAMLYLASIAQAQNWTPPGPSPVLPMSPGGKGVAGADRSPINDTKPQPPPKVQQPPPKVQQPPPKVQHPLPKNEAAEAAQQKAEARAKEAEEAQQKAETRAKEAEGAQQKAEARAKKAEEAQKKAEVAQRDTLVLSSVALGILIVAGLAGAGLYFWRRWNNRQTLANGEQEQPPPNEAPTLSFKSPWYRRWFGR